MEAATEIEQNVRIAELERDVRELRSALTSHHLRSELRPNNGVDLLLNVIRQLIEITNDLVPGKVSIENSVDPEYPETTHIIFRVDPEKKLDDVNAIIDKEIEWHRRARAIFPEATCYFRLLID
jgi:hypothetical protein